MFALRSHKDKWRILSVGAASFLTIFPLCVWRHLDIIEEDIYDRALAVLSEANIKGLDIAVNGRDVSLAGPAPESELVRAAQLLESLKGVRKVSQGANGNRKEGEG